MSLSAATRDWLCLSLLPGLGPAGAARLVDHFGDVRRVLKASSAERMAVPGVRASQLAGFDRLEECRRQADRELAGISSLGGTILTREAPGYPGMLREIPDPPVVLYALGDISLLESRCVAMVGSRSATAYGRRAAGSLAESLAAHGVTVVSGMALGIDSEAHGGALKAHGATIAVLGCGIDVVYPRQNQPLYRQISTSGLLLSEYPLGTQPEGFRFPARNRIIAGMSLGVVVVEATRKSGSLITAQLALDFGREVFAVPGQIDSFKSEGTHWLLRQGAQLVASGGDIVAGLGIAGFCPGGKAVGDGRDGLSALDPDAAALLRHLEPYPISRDEVAGLTGLGPARLSELLLFLELEGHIEMLAGDLVRRLTI